MIGNGMPGPTEKRPTGTPTLIQAKSLSGKINFPRKIEVGSAKVEDWGSGPVTHSFPRDCVKSKEHARGSKF